MWSWVGWVGEKNLRGVWEWEKCDQNILYELFSIKKKDFSRVQADWLDTLFYWIEPVLWLACGFATNA